MAIRHRQVNRTNIFNKFYQDEQKVVYVNSVSGNNSNTGLSFSQAKLTVASALTTLGASGKVKIYAPITTPIIFTSISSGNYSFESYDDNYWYTEGVLQRTSGWTNTTSTIYTQNSGASGNDPYIETLLDSDGYYARLRRNLSTPTTPANGEWGYTGGAWYVNFPAGENPNSHTIKFPSFTRGWAISGSTKVNFSKGYFRYCDSEGLIDLTNTSSVRCNGCVFQYGGSGIEAIDTSTVVCHDCISFRNQNDGFNARNSAKMYLYDCESYRNLDEGVSPHDSSQLTLTNSYFHHNLSGGCTAINSTSMVINNCIISNNGLNAQAGIEANGINYSNTASGQITNTISRDNNRSGFYCTSSGSIAFDNFSSGIANGNIEADDLC